MNAVVGCNKTWKYTAVLLAELCSGLGNVVSGFAPVSGCRKSSQSLNYAGHYQLAKLRSPSGKQKRIKNTEDTYMRNRDYCECINCIALAVYVKTVIAAKVDQFWL
jgi:hypothetical protein